MVFSKKKPFLMKCNGSWLPFWGHGPFCFDGLCGSLYRLFVSKRTKCRFFRIVYDIVTCIFLV